MICQNKDVKNLSTQGTILYLLDRLMESATRHETTFGQLEAEAITTDVDHRKSREPHPSIDEIDDIDIRPRAIPQDFK